MLNQWKKNAGYQYVICFLLVGLVSVTCFYTVDYLGYRTVALILLLIVSLTAILFDIIPVMLTAFSSALIWNYFFIPPVHTWFIEKTEDTLMFFMYFVVASINAVLTYKIRDIETKARDKEEKEKTIVLYDTLLNSLSHELRTPISTVIGAIDTIEENANKLSTEDISLLHKEIKIAGLRLNNQVENILSISRLESGMIKPIFDWCDVNEIIFTILRNYKEESAKHRIQFMPAHDLPFYKTDRWFLLQIIQNLFYNAILYTPPNTKIKISCESSEDFLVIIVEDNGHGFPVHDLPLVFNKFYRLSIQGTHGLGLGLSIAKGFTEALSGKIKLENIISGGAKFTILIPAESSSTISITNE